MNCKKGDLAIKTRSRQGSNIGALLRVVRWVGEGPRDSDNWEVEALQSIVPTHGPDAGRRLPPGVRVLVPDWCLTPLRGGDTADTKQKEVCHDAN